MNPLATLDQLYRYGANASVLQSVPVQTQQDEILAASALAYGSFASIIGVGNELVEWSEDVTINVCKIAAYNLLCIRGFNPGSGSDINFRARHDDAITWLKGVANHSIHPVLKVANSNIVTDGQGPRVVSRRLQRRRYSDFGDY